ncbi:MAG: Substrate-specific component NikM of nickel ECF transporter [Anaerolineae bacterium]|nr:MAG: Substrate-specific component NikM of nickel ECF transporter [Anaerolineae bacterium]
MVYSPTPMHIPDGFLSTGVSVVMWIVSIAVIAYSLKRVGNELGERQVPFMGVLAAAIFAGQMLNFTVVGGTSGHLLGAALATILLGPWAAVIVMTSVVAIQALIFQDGGLVVLGANLFNMAIIGVAVAYMVYRTIYRLSNGRQWGIFVGGFIAAWASIELAALACALELAASGTSPANVAVPAMGGIHALIGIGEGLITLGALAFLYATRRDLPTAGESSATQGKLVWGVGLAIALLLAIFSPLASAYPDGLEWVAEEHGFIETAQGPLYEIIPDYVFPGVSNEALATILAGIVGTLIVFGVALAIGYARRKRQAA